MTRKEFLQKAGAGAFFAISVGCFGSCAKENISPGGNNPAAVDFTLDLNSSTNAALNNPGGYVIVDNNVVVARTLQGDFIAASRTCSHEPRKEVIFRDNEFYCTAHGARFTTSGGGLNDKGKNGLPTYQTSLNGNTLHVFTRA